MVYHHHEGSQAYGGKGKPFIVGALLKGQADSLQPYKPDVRYIEGKPIEH